MSTMTLTSKNRRMAVTFLVAGIAAIFAEHALKPTLKKRLRVR